LAQQDEAKKAGKEQDKEIFQDIGAWLNKHNDDVTRPLITGFVKFLRAQPGTENVVAVGFCWYFIESIVARIVNNRGGRHTGLLSSSKLSPGATVDAGFGCHPTGLTPENINDIDVPYGIAIGDHDQMMSMDAVKQAESILVSKKGEVVVYPGQVKF
jgi:dienelactone hydrolase